MAKQFWLHAALWILVTFFMEFPWPSVLLVLAQLFLIPLMFLSIVEKKSRFKRSYYYFALPAYGAIAWMSIFPSKWNGLLAIVYLLFTLFIAFYGIRRFIRRGFCQLEEFVIDCGFVFLPVGGIWFVAYELGIDTGFSPIITWLTAIHFHYSAFLMLVFIGLLGRIQKGPLYPYLASSMIVLPWVMAVGITLSPWVELIGIIVYILTVFLLIFYSLTATYTNRLQKVLVTLSFSSVGLTILFACLYILSHSFGYQLVSIPWMLLFHGLTNAVIFGLIGSIGWLIAVPISTWRPLQFPISSIRRKYKPSDYHATVNGLVDDMEKFTPFIQPDKVAQTVIDFYEQTQNYHLYARVHWQAWFKPFAFVYRQLSRFLEQINLPLSSKQIEMTGKIYRLENDGREDVRAWVRKAAGETIFVALYSYHTHHERTYMNIALPLPFTSMHGILALNEQGKDLELTSKRKNRTMEDAGIYLVFGKNIRFRLPLSETFYVREMRKGKLEATHHMDIFGLRFLTISYEIEK